MAMKFVDTLFPLLDEAGDGGGGGGTGEENPGGAGNEGAGKPGAADSQNAGAGKPGAAPDKPAEDPRIKGILADLQKNVNRVRSSSDGLRTETLDTRRNAAVSWLWPASTRSPRKTSTTMRCASGFGSLPRKPLVFRKRKSKTSRPCGQKPPNCEQRQHIRGSSMPWACWMRRSVKWEALWWHPHGSTENSHSARLRPRSGEQPGILGAA